MILPIKFTLGVRTKRGLPIRIRIHFEGQTTHVLELPDFQAAAIGDRVKIVRQLAWRVYNVLQFFGGNTVGLSGAGRKTMAGLIQNLHNEFKRSGATAFLQQVVTAGAPLQIVEVSLLTRSADGLGRWAQKIARGSAQLDPSKTGIALGIDIGLEKVKTLIMRDGKAIFKGMYPAALGRDGEAGVALSQESLNRGIQSAAMKTLEIAARSNSGKPVLVDGAVLTFSRHARINLLPEPKWLLEALSKNLQCPIWIHTDRTAQALACGQISDKSSLLALSFGSGLSFGVLRNGMPLRVPQSAEYFWADTTKDVLQGATLALLNSQAELAAAKRKGFKGALGAADTTEINQSAADKSHPMHYRAVEVVRDMAKHAAWSIVELHSFCPFSTVALTGARISQVGPLLAGEIDTIITREHPELNLEILAVEQKMNSGLTGAYGAALLAGAHYQGLDVGGEAATLYTGGGA